MERLARKAREYHIRRGEILRQAEKIFSLKGFRNATMAEIAGSSGYAVGTVYQIFEGKEHLYTIMVSEKIETMYSCVRKAVAQADTVFLKIEALVKGHFRFVEANMNFCRLFVIGESIVLSEGMTRLRNTMIEGYLDHIRFIEGFIVAGIRSGELKSMDPRAVASSLLGMINAFTFHWIITAEALPLSAKVCDVVDLFLTGVVEHER